MNILHEDNHIIVLVKPAGVVVQADASGDPDFLAEIKSYRRRNENKAGEAYVGLVHRLDRMVGGVMVFAKTSKAASRLSEQVRTRNFRKQYLAIVRGTDLPGGVMEDYLLKDPSTNISKVVHHTHPGAKHSTLSYMRVAEDHGLSLVCVQLLTGRSHQIRVQFASRGWPLQGDVKYGLETSETKGPALWSYSIGFEHPVMRQVMEFHAMPPETDPWIRFADSLMRLKLSL